MKLESVSIAGRFQIFIALVLAFLQYLLDSKVNIESFSCLLLNLRNPRRFDFWNERQSLWKSVKRRREVASTFQRSSVETEKKDTGAKSATTKRNITANRRDFFGGGIFTRIFGCQAADWRNGVKWPTAPNQRTKSMIAYVFNPRWIEKLGGTWGGRGWGGGGVDYAEEEENWMVTTRHSCVTMRRMCWRHCCNSTLLWRHFENVQIVTKKNIFEFFCFVRSLWDEPLFSPFKLIRKFDWKNFDWVHFFKGLHSIIRNFQPTKKIEKIYLTSLLAAITSVGFSSCPFSAFESLIKTHSMTFSMQPT